MKYTNKNEHGWMNIFENTTAKIAGSNKVYHLLNSINLPINSEAEPRMMVFDSIGQDHFFVLEFEKLPNITDFSIFEEPSNPNAFNFEGIKVDTTQKRDFVNIDDFIADYPVKEFGRYVVKGTNVSYYKFKGVTVSMTSQIVKQYGKYFTLSINVQNLSGRSILFDPSKIYSQGYQQEKDKYIDLQVLSAAEYDKKVASKQSWNNFWVAVGEGVAASAAGYSSSTTDYSQNSYTTGSAHASYYDGNSYGYANAYGSAYTTTYGRAHTTTYDGAAAYAAQQQANANVSNFANNQYAIREQLSDGYVKLNTIRNEVEYSGYFNVKFKKVDSFLVSLVIDGETYQFVYTVPK